MSTIAVIFGGRSAEHDVSIITAHIPIIESLRVAGRYDIWPVYIAKDGTWYADKKMLELSYFKDPNYEEKLKRLKPIAISFDNGLDLISSGIFGKKIHIDLAFPAMHGTYGEDGSLMGLLRMANVPFVGCDIFASAVAMDKVLTKEVVAAEGIPVVPYVWFTKSEWERGGDAIRKKMTALSFPLFVKPVHLGSSIGITKAKDDAELERAIEVALHYDDKVLVEKAVENLIEVTLPILGNGEPHPAEVERALNKTEFFDFSDKYLSGGKKGAGVNSQYSEIPANIGKTMTKKVKETGVAVYRALGCEGIARVDFLIDGSTKEIFVNEVNTLPGSLYHHNWKKHGVSNVALVEGLITLAKERHAKKSATTFTFTSDILSKVGGPKTQK